MASIIIVVLVSLLFSAFFSGMEIAFLSSNKLKLEIEKKQNRAFSFVARVFSRHPGQYITTILVGNNVALVIYSMYMSLLIKSLLGIGAAVSGWTLILETLISTLVIIFAGEYIPKTMVRLDPNFYYRVFYLPVYLFYILFYPVSKLTTLLSVGVLRLAGMPLRQDRALNTFDKVDLAHLLEEAAEQEGEAENEKDIRLFQNALDFPDLTVRDCMVPRVDIEAIEDDCPIGELTRRFIDSGYSRILVYSGNIDNIVGYVNTKSLFRDPASIGEIIKPVDYVPETMSAQRLLTNFVKKQHSIAVVIDEFGGTAGMATIEDVLEEIFGEIEDEHDAPDMVEKKISDSEYIFSGRLEVEYLNERYGLGIPESEEYDTLAGYVIYRHKGIPAVGDIILADDKKVKVLRMDSSKIELVRVSVI